LKLLSSRARASAARRYRSTRYLFISFLEI